tara:strand:- start:52 stop:1041 length:990 start_codon:yes stop_codon:yes gene_type:complete
MANGLFNTQNNAAQVMMLMEAERAKRIRDAGAGMDPIVASMARAQQGMRESVGDLARAGAGLFGTKMPQDPRLSQAMKRDKDRNEMMQLLQGFAADGNITEDEVKIGYTQLMRRGYMQEAREFIQQAASMGTMRRAERGLDIQEEGLDLRKKADARAAATDELARKKAEAEAEMRPLEKQKKEAEIRLLEKRIATMGTGGDKYSELRESEKKAVKKYITDNPEITKAFDSRFKDNAGSTFGKPNEENIRAVVEAMAKLRTQKAYKSKSTLELLKIVLGSSKALAATTGGGRTFKKPPAIVEPRPALMPQGSFRTPTGGINSPMPKPSSR